MMSSLTHWQTERASRQQTLWRLLGAMPPLPQVVPAEVTATTRTASYTRSDLTLTDTLTGQTIPAVLLLPNQGEPPYPAVMYLHAHGHRYDLGKSEVFAPRAGDIIPADDLTERGYAVFCIDAYAFEGRQHPDEMTLFKQFLWEGRSLWGMMLRDDRLALTFLAAHPAIDANRIAALGMSLGSTRAFWLAALDDRVAVTVAVACLTRYADLITADGLAAHSIYFYVPGIMHALDVEAVTALIAPRPFLALNGDRDPTSPLSGIQTITRHTAEIYALYGQPERFRSDIYADTGHVFTVDMWAASVAWLRRWL